MSEEYPLQDDCYSEYSSDRDDVPVETGFIPFLGRAGSGGHNRDRRKQGGGGYNIDIAETTAPIITTAMLRSAPSPYESRPGSTSGLGAARTSDQQHADTLLRLHELYNERHGNITGLSPLDELSAWIISLHPYERVPIILDFPVHPAGKEYIHETFFDVQSDILPTLFRKLTAFDLTLFGLICCSHTKEYFRSMLQTFAATMPNFIRLFTDEYLNAVLLLLRATLSSGSPPFNKRLWKANELYKIRQTATAVVGTSVPNRVTMYLMSCVISIACYLLPTYDRLHARDVDVLPVSIDMQITDVFGFICTVAFSTYPIATLDVQRMQNKTDKLTARVDNVHRMKTGVSLRSGGSYYHVLVKILAEKNTSFLATPRPFCAVGDVLRPNRHRARVPILPRCNLIVGQHISKHDYDVMCAIRVVYTRDCDGDVPVPERMFTYVDENAYSDVFMAHSYTIRPVSLSYEQNIIETYTSCAPASSTKPHDPYSATADSPYSSFYVFHVYMCAIFYVSPLLQSSFSSGKSSSYWRPQPISGKVNELSKLPRNDQSFRLDVVCHCKPKCPTIDCSRSVRILMRGFDPGIATVRNLLCTIQRQLPDRTESQTAQYRSAFVSLIPKQPQPDVKFGTKRARVEKPVVFAPLKQHTHELTGPTISQTGPQTGNTTSEPWWVRLRPGYLGDYSQWPQSGPPLQQNIHSHFHNRAPSPVYMGRIDPVTGQEVYSSDDDN
jgi:hypothetical protein